MVGKYDNNTRTVEYVSGSIIYSCSKNSGYMRIMEDSKILKCSRNHGELYFGKRSKVGTIHRNHSDIYIDDNSTVALITKNSGRIYLGKGCRVENIIDNEGLVHANRGSILPTSGYGGGIVEVRNVDAPLGQSPPPVTPRRQQSWNGSRSSVSTTLSVVNDSPRSSPLPVVPRKRQSSNSSRSMSSSSLSAHFEDNTCSVCLMNRRNMAFRCGHVSCDTCAKFLTTCHICRTQITERIKLYL